MPPWWALASELPAFGYARAGALVGWAVELVSTRLVGIVGAGHVPHEEQPEAVLAAVRPFWAEVAGG